jgi:hypothetical protein
MVLNFIYSTLQQDPDSVISKGRITGTGTMSQVQDHIFGLKIRVQDLNLKG